MSGYNYEIFNMQAERPNFEGFVGNLHVGERAPDILPEDLDSGETVRLKDLWLKGLMVAKFGSFT